MSDKDPTLSPHSPVSATRFRALLIGAIGVVYGDIGTSPLYTLREAFTAEHGVRLTQGNILGILSLILWSLVIIVALKYVMVVMRADNKGEGGILALMALAQRAIQRKSLLITSVGIIGAALFYGDGIITPAISVLSAVEGLKIATPFFDPYIVPIAVVIIIVLFSVQQHGSDRIGKAFGPITCVWFLSLGALGLHQIVANPVVLHAFNPLHGLEFLFGNGKIGFLTLGTVVLCVTGAEALYADMGHFGAKPIRMAWLYFVMPCLMLNYLGQGALLIARPETIENPFFRMIPAWGLYPMIGLATMATVIASQAMITGAYSVTQQAIHLDFMPRFSIKHTSSSNIGQIYMPSLNLLMFVGVLLLVLWFHSSSALASAYGLAVTGTMLMTSMLVFLVSWKLWHWPLWRTILTITPFIVVDAAFFSSTLMKLEHGIGAWIPLILGLLIYTLMITWYQGKEIKNIRMAIGRERLDNFIAHLDEKKASRVGGTAIYLTRDLTHVPPALSINLKHYKAIHETVLLVKIDTLDVPRANDSERFTLQELGNGFTVINIFYGFMQQPNIPRALHHLNHHGIEINMHDATYFMNRVRVVATPGSGMWLWREKLYALMHRNAAEASDFFRLPASKVIETGSPVTI